MRDIRDRFDAAVERLYARNEHLAVAATRIGYPVLEESVPTAGVGWDKDRKRVKFIFNPRFAEKLSDEEFDFVVSHETMHLVNAHIFLFRDEVDRMKREKKSGCEIHIYTAMLNVAADCVANDSLTVLYGTDRLEMIGGVKPLYGMEVVRCHCHDLLTKDVMSLLPEGGSGGEGAGHEGWGSFLDENGNLSKEFISAVRNMIEQNINNSAISDEDRALAEEMLDRMKESRDANARQAGKDAMAAIRKLDSLSQNSINWGRILTDITKTKKVEDRWNRPNRKLMSLYPSVILPSVEEAEKQEIFVAIDTSGSIDHAAVNLFCSVVRNTPKHFKVNAITFDTACYPFDIKGEPRGGGGTDFQIIENYIKENCKRYPRAIFVLTDGCGTKVSPKHSNRWCWLLYGSCEDTYVKHMKHYRLENLLR